MQESTARARRAYISHSSTVAMSSSGHLHRHSESRIILIHQSPAETELCPFHSQQPSPSKIAPGDDPLDPRTPVKTPQQRDQPVTPRAFL
nr:hypothetical protein Iba_chr15cCG2720 [Ipomoea batatas]